MALRFETARLARPPAPPNCPAGGRLSTTRQPNRRKSESGARAFSMRPVPEAAEQILRVAFVARDECYAQERGTEIFLAAKP
jgi:hypothetical protein